MLYMDHIDALNTHDMSGFRPVFVAGREIGWMRHGVAERLALIPGGVFEVGPFGVAIGGAAASPDARTAAVAAALSPLIDEGLIPPRRGELYPVVERWGEPVLFALDRAHVAALGVRAFGVHINGFVRRPDGLHMWIARRADDRTVAPGRLDNMVAGGQAVGLGLMENVLKECAEEAGLTPDVAGGARPAGLVSYCVETALGLKPDTLFVFDLELPESIVPDNQDGEIQAFMLWPIERVLETLREPDAFKFNVPHVILDFAVRHGVLTPDDTPEYARIATGLRRVPVCFHPSPERA
ncbi:DUF4743 domain-containing protein [Roseospira marina]|uniref:DUF4743 domain-containing protein n=1 Tax=Roseospira marina TaxID=140057 RepID=A0A5M6IEH1_9PROT|nr:DUF4743 domain-containing protein [Roseospira marina]KAA5606686.1 DUF4743 domain-containing protein [Roseospira marina]MBB4313902.1 8-oxo-dGTP pyrophosphatase MutT (NUDIX family) [Roseospira marina]MBB5087064.1 8-oxo-dGTP pyrophosphatase MutT (NUDIX family) [Roseospira marina]